MNFFDQMCGSRMLPKLLTYFLQHPTLSLDYSSLCRNIGEERRAPWRQLNQLVKVGFITKDTSFGRPQYKLNKDFILLDEFNSIAGKMIV